MAKETKNILIIGCILLVVMLAACSSDSNGANAASDSPVDDGNGENEDNTIAGTFSLSGVIIAPSMACVDSDVNDVNAPYESNDDFEHAQNINNPVTLAGYVNLSGTGAQGRSYLSGDSVDIFRTTMAEGDVISLYIADYRQADIDIRLYDAQTRLLVDESVGTQSSESLSVPGDGDYFIEVVVVDGGRGPFASNGSSTYTLVLGQDSSTLTDSVLRLSDNFVAGDIVARFSDEDDAVDPNEWGHKKAADLGMGHKGGAAGRPMLLDVADDMKRNNAMQMLGIQGASCRMDAQPTDDDHLQRKRDTLQLIKALRRRSDVAYADLNYIRKASQVPNDTYYHLQWHYDQINVPSAWDVSTGNDNVVVAVVDTGVLMDHPDLTERLTSDGYDFVSELDLEGNESSDEIGGIDDNPDDPGDESVGGSTFHGTHVAGTIAATTDNDKGVAGIAWQSANVMALRVLGVGGSGTSYDIMQAVYYAAGLPNDSGTLPGRRADIINLSLGGASYSSDEQAVFDVVREAGVIVVAAAGNESGNRASYPAAYDGVISVSAVDASSTLAYYSNYGSTIDVAAPGGDTSNDLNNDGYPDGIISTVGDDSSGEIEMVYGFSTGTSMASPHVAGVLALMKTLWLDMTPADVDSLLQAGAITTELGDVGRDDKYGYGLIDAQKAILAAQEGTVPTLIVGSTASLSFGANLSTSTLTVEKLGDPDAVISVTNVGCDSEWLTVNENEIDANGIGTYTVSVDRTGLSDGSYTATITITSTENTVTVSVFMQVAMANPTADAGYQYVLLIDALSEETLDTVSMGITDGVYNFKFTGVETGEYLIYAGTDLDGDYYIGDAGEAFGAYLSLDQPISFFVESDMTNLDFVTEYGINLSEPEIDTYTGYTRFQRLYVE